MRQFWIDTDTASDDATAILMALRWPDVEVLGISIVSGNMPIEQGAKNALYTVELCGKTTPVYIGAGRPLLRETVHAHWFHGADGMSNRNYPPAKQQPESQHAIDALIATVKAHPGLTLVTLGPLTNIALAVRRAPEIAGLVGRCVVMGGAACVEGNVTPAAEYNIWCDPEAARMVFHSGLPVEMVGWEHSRGEFVITDADADLIRGFDTPLGHFVIDCNQSAAEAFKVQTGEYGITLPDPVAMAVALDPTICTHKSQHFVEVETHSELTRGATVVDKLGVTNDERNQAVWGALRVSAQPITVCWELDPQRWKEALYSTLR